MFIWRGVKLQKNSGYATYRLEGGDLGCAAKRLHVVDSDAAILLEPEVCELRDALERAILGRSEVYAGSPVVAHVLGKGAGGARRQLGGVHVLWVHLRHGVQSMTTSDWEQLVLWCL